MKKIVSVFLFFLLFLTFVSTVYADTSIIGPSDAQNGQSIQVTVQTDSATVQSRNPELVMLDSSQKEIFCQVLGTTTNLTLQMPQAGNSVTLQVVEGGQSSNLQSICNHPATPKIIQQRNIALTSSVTPAVSGTPSTPVTPNTPACTMTRTKGSPQGDMLNISVNNWDCNTTGFLTLIAPPHFHDTSPAFTRQIQTKPGECNNGTLATTTLFTQVVDPSTGDFQAVAKGNYTLEVRKNSFTDPRLTTCTYNNIKDDPDQVLTFLPTITPPPVPCATGKLEPLRSGADIVYKCDAVNTAIGDISTDPVSFIKDLFAILLSLGGGIAVLIIIATGYRMMTSQGDPEKIKGARETMTSAIVGLLFMIFSMVILQIIGVDILKIPGFQ